MNTTKCKKGVLRSAKRESYPPYNGERLLLLKQFREGVSKGA
jgi:hypothetical protein